MPGSNNDVNVLDRSPLVTNMLRGPSEDLTFTVNGKQYSQYYLLADGIYPQWSCFVQTIHSAQDEKQAHYSKMQESTRKDIERCFGVLQRRFRIIANPSKLWNTTIMANIMYACIIMHNMIVEDESSEHTLEPLFQVEAPTGSTGALPFEALLAGTEQLENTDLHYSLRGDLVEHLWTLKGLSTY
jgi:hypothetical protein